MRVNAREIGAAPMDLSIDDTANDTSVLRLRPPPLLFLLFFPS